MTDDAFDDFGKMGVLGDMLSGLVGGLAKSGILPKNTPEGKLLIAQSELSDLRKQEGELLMEVGRQAYQQNPSAWTQDNKLKLIYLNIAAAQATINEAKREKEQAATANASGSRATSEANDTNPQSHDNQNDSRLIAFGKYSISTMEDERGIDLVKMFPLLGKSTDDLSLEFLDDGKCLLNMSAFDGGMEEGTYSVDKNTITIIGSNGSNSIGTISGNTIIIELDGTKQVYEKRM